MRAGFLIFSILFIFSSCFIQKNKSQPTIWLEIDQKLVEPNFIFEISKNRLLIYESNLKGNKRKIFSKKLRLEQVNFLSEKLAPIMELDNNYVKAALGGIEWQLKIEHQGRRKNLQIINVEVLEVQELFKEINSVIPDGKPMLILNAL